MACSSDLPLPVPRAGAYSASKAGLLAATDALRLELAPFNVRVAYAACGQIRSALADNSLAAGSVQRYEQAAALYAPFAPAIRCAAGWRDGIRACAAPWVPASLRSSHALALLTLPPCTPQHARARAGMSQARGVMPAEAVADQIAAVVNAAALGRPAWGGAWGARCCRLLDGCRAAAARLLAGVWPAPAARVAPAPAEQAQQAAAAAAVAAEEEEEQQGAARREEAGIRRRAPRPPPTWFLAGGGALKFWVLGVLQKLAPFGGWPANWLIARQFGVHRALRAPQQQQA